MTTQNAHFEVDKIFRQIEFISSSFDLKLWTASHPVSHVVHDVVLMRSHGDLHAIRLQLLSGRSVVAEFAWEFVNNRGQSRVFDTGNGIELPLIASHRVTSLRFQVKNLHQGHRYRDRLWLHWPALDDLHEPRGSRFDSEHAARITGGRQKGTFFASNSDRHRLQITNVGTRGFAFARDLDFENQNVFLLQRFANPGVVFKPGAVVTAIVVQTPKGLQARDVEVS